MYRVDIIVVDEAVPEVASDRPEVVRTFTVSSTPYKKRDLAEKLALRTTEWGITNESRITGKR